MGSSSLRWRPLFYLVCLTVFWLGTLDANRYEAVYLPTGVIIRHGAASCVVCAREERLPFCYARQWLACGFCILLDVAAALGIVHILGYEVVPLW